eukprot:CAMPEP_0172569176 /NCGR_PEP_ID=MMETSP1067-20121228/122534_1 /TAXON_ID=265564 ORGANISM="Thalassiosira punctigera, Strain Tpunct2005C2" /NCGR_SAMPLE_ID=MMETSP1067 /ASSEMBLY_ACC=CAM_ASM_000444 /LENGTH=111 /DNA_ID=CAMNT_0013360955 /DNA_START=425 /DNA_END=757 /DNA_ORIENTATION=-
MNVCDAHFVVSSRCSSTGRFLCASAASQPNSGQCNDNDPSAVDNSRSQRPDHTPNDSCLDHVPGTLKTKEDVNDGASGVAHAHHQGQVRPGHADGRDEEGVPQDVGDRGGE